MRRKAMYVVGALAGLAVLGSFLPDSGNGPCRPASAAELDAVNGFWKGSYAGPRATEAWVVERDGHDFYAVPIDAGMAVFGSGAFAEGNDPIAAVANDAARTVSNQGVDIASGTPAAEVTGLDDAEGIALAEGCGA